MNMQNLKINFIKEALMGSWSSHYNSWKNYKSKETLLVKYEDMVNKSNSTFFKSFKLS